MEKAEINAFRARFRGEIIERLVLRHALLEPVLNRHLSLEESRMALKDWLDISSDTADQAYGAYFRDPAQTALYADEVKDLVESMKREVDALADEAAKIIAAQNAK